MKNKQAIKIPVGLAEYVVRQRFVVNTYETNKIIRAVDTWLCLKSVTTTGHILRYDTQLQYLLQLCKISRASFYSRLHYLQTEKLITWNKKNKRIAICSWETLAKYFDLDKQTTFITIQYDITDNRRIYQFLSAIEIDANQLAQRKALQNRINKNPELKNTLISLMLNYGAEADRINDAVYFQQTLWQMQVESFKRGTGTDTYEALHALHADVNRSTHRAFKRSRNYKSAQSVSYEKKCLEKAGIISIEKIEVVSRVRARKEKDYRVRWLKHKKQTIWFLPDQVKTIPSTEPVLRRISA